MKKKFRISKPSMTKIYSSGCASSFWSTSFDTDSKVNRGGKKSVDHTKLAATQRAIANFVNIVTGKQIPVVFILKVFVQDFQALALYFCTIYTISKQRHSLSTI